MGRFRLKPIKSQYRLVVFIKQKKEQNTHFTYDTGYFTFEERYFFIFFSLVLQRDGFIVIVFFFFFLSLRKPAV